MQFWNEYSYPTYTNSQIEHMPHGKSKNWYNNATFLLQQLNLNWIEAPSSIKNQSWWRKSCYLATFSTKGFNFNLIKHNQNKGTMGAAKYSCCVLFCQIYGTWNCSKFNCFPGLADFKDFTLEIPEQNFLTVLPKIILCQCYLKLCYHPASV